MKSFEHFFRLSLVLLLFGNALPISAAAPLAYDYVVTVLDEKGQPLFGVNVFTNDQQKVATTSDENGKATLKDVNNNEEVNFTFVGYNPLRLPFYEIRKRNGIIRMSRSAEQLAEIVVIGRRDDLPGQVPYTYTKIDKKDIAFFESQTTADALWNTAGVFVQKTQMGGGSPVLRGFEANRVLLVVDGVRMNTAAYRSGHLQNSITVDNAMLERTEVIFGPGSLMYGSDALGGVIHFRSKEPKLALNDRPQLVESGLYTRFSSANQEKSIHADVNIGKKTWASMTSLTYTDYNDLRSGNKRPVGYEDFGKRLFYVERVGNGDQIVQNVLVNGEENYNVQVGSAYGQIDFMQKIKFQPNRNFYTLLNFQQSTSTDVPRYDFLTELTDPSDPTSFRYAEWFYGPQRRLLASVKMGMSKSNALYDRAVVIAAFQRVHENRLQRTFGNSQRIFQLENVFAYSFTADLDKNLNDSGRSKLMYGVELNHNDLKSESGRVRITTENITRNALSRYPSDNDMTTLAGYANYHLNTADSSFSFTSGLRYTWVKLLSLYSNDSTSTWPAYFYSPGVTANNSDLTWSIGGTWRPALGTEIKVLGSKAFRSPNIDDFSQFRPRNGFISIPNPALKPERSYNGELAISQEIGQNANGFRMRLGATGYYTYVQGFMTRRSFPLPDGSTIVRVDGFDYETRAMVNATYGIIKGLGLEMQARFGKYWSLESNLSLITGGASFEVKDVAGMVVFDTLAPLDHIPPKHGFTSLTYSNDKIKLSVVARYQMAKTIDQYGVSGVKLDGDGNPVLSRNGTEDNIEYSYYRINPDNGKVVYDGTLAWTTYNLYTSWKINKTFTLNFAMENILDLHYRPFASGISAAGRNFITSLRVNLGK